MAVRRDIGSALLSWLSTFGDGLSMGEEALSGLVERASRVDSGAVVQLERCTTSLIPSHRLVPVAQVVFQVHSLSQCMNILITLEAHEHTATAPLDTTCFSLREFVATRRFLTASVAPCHQLVMSS